MSRSVLVIPEDPTLDHYVLKPVIQAACKQVGRARTTVRVLTDPSVKGVDQALDRKLLRLVVERYPMVDLFLICVDRDGKPGRDVSVADRVTEMSTWMRGHQRAGGRTAEQELEVWCVASQERLPSPWRTVREDPDAKEHWFGPLVSGLGLAQSPGGGREILGRQAASQYSRVRQRCPELNDIETCLAAL